MQSRIIKTYLNWLNEAAAPAAGTQPAAANAVDGIAFVGVSASASNLMDGTKFGFKKDIVYTITVPNLGVLRFLADDGDKFGGPNTKTDANPNGRIQINLDSTEKTAKPGDDMLEIAGKKILESGDILLKKSELTGAVTIKASNNGMLLLLRFATALADMKERFVFYLGNCKNYAVKFTLGKPVAEADARGFTYYWTRPGALSGVSSTMCAILSIATLEQLGLQSSIATSDGVFNGYYSYVKGKDLSSTGTEIATKVAAFVKGNRTLTNEPLPDMTGLLAKVTKENYQTLVTGNPQTKKYKLTAEGTNTLVAAVNSLAAAIAPTKPPAAFAEAADVFSDYGTIVKNNLVTSANAGAVNNWFEKVQNVQNWIKGSSTKGGSGTGGQKQGEGEVGPK